MRPAAADGAVAEARPVGRVGEEAKAAHLRCGAAQMRPKRGGAEARRTRESARADDGATGMVWRCFVAQRLAFRTASFLCSYLRVGTSECGGNNTENGMHGN